MTIKKPTPILVLVLVLVLVLGACSSSASDPAAPAPAPLTPSSVTWNPSSVDVGTVQAVAEQDSSLLLFGSKGVLTLTSGSVVSSDDSITTWRSAAVIPSADGLSSWMVGVDDSGHLQRIRTDLPPLDVSARYGLGDEKVTTIAAAQGRVAFLLESGVAVSDGANVTRYKAAARAVTASGTLVAVADSGAGTVRVFNQGMEVDVPLADAQLVAYDSGGNLVAATGHALFRITGAQVETLYDGGARSVHGLAASGANVWFTVDGDLGVVQDGRVSLGSGGTLANDARLVGSTSGDVWVLGAALQRFSAAGGAAGDEATWNSTVQPVYAAVCSNCHSAPGSGKSSSNIDLSTYDAWKGRRATIYQRVVGAAGTPAAMPPPTSAFSLTDPQRAAIAAWAKP